MGSSVVMALSDVSGEVQGEHVTIEAGQRVAANHRLVQDNPEAFGPADDPATDLDELRAALAGPADDDEADSEPDEVA